MGGVGKAKGKGKGQLQKRAKLFNTVPVLEEDIFKEGRSDKPFFGISAIMNNKNLHRAVITSNRKLLRNILTSKHKISSLIPNWSADCHITSLHIALETSNDFFIKALITEL